MVLAGLIIALGLVIDDAIVDVERILQRLRQTSSRAGLKSPVIILEAVGETRSTLFLPLITLLAIVPSSSLV
jgi:multidrug efflux pump subunit AcrB